MPEENFSRILNNLADDAEKKEFFRSLENDSEKREQFYHYKNLYVISQLKPDHYRRQEHNNFNKFWNKVQADKSNHIIHTWLKYAAIFVAAITLGFMANHILIKKERVMYLGKVEYSSEIGSISSIRLEDGSNIWLSSGTKLILNKTKQGETLVQLDGEAYFDLIPDPERKLSVDLGHFKVKDIGTQFNIRAYKSEQSITAALIEGQIDLINGAEKSFLTLKPGDFVYYSKSNNEIAVTQKDASIVTAWKDGKFVFIDKSLTEICTELENWYNIEIMIDDQKLANTRYTCVVKRSSTVQMVLKMLAVTDQIKYNINEKKEGKDIIHIRK
jgi:ferric-dicitrate binding protein FerR (iron transport regulator)